LNWDQTTFNRAGMKRNAADGLFTKSSKIEQLITKLKIRSFTKVDIEGRGLSLHVDESNKEEETKAHKESVYKKKD
jgi:hypothetical protein